MSALFDTDYGITLLVKVALVAGLVGLGALNHFFWAPAVRAGGRRADRRFGLNSRGELVVALGVLAATAVLSGLLPAAHGRCDRVRRRQGAGRRRSPRRAATTRPPSASS